MRTLVTALVLLAACKKTQESPKATGAAAASATIDAAAPAPARTTCVAEPARGIAIPASARATDIRVASTDTKAFVTWWERPMGPDGRPVDSAFGHLFDGSTVGPRVVINANDLGDQPISAAVPVAIGGELSAITCTYFAPEGRYTCGKAAPAGEIAPLFTFTGLATGGPVLAGIAAVATATDTAVFVPGGPGADVRALSASVSGKKRTYAFGDRYGDDPKLPFPDALAAAASGPDEVTVVYRFAGVIRARRAGFDEVWRGKPTTLSTPKHEVGAPATASDGTHVVALFSEREKASAPWHVAMSDLSTTTALPLGDQAQGPGIAARGSCFVVSWVEGAGKTTRTRVGRLCDGAIDPKTIATLSAGGVEGGRAYLTKDFVVWQELPTGKPAELRIAKLVCP